MFKKHRYYKTHLLLCARCMMPLGGRQWTDKHLVGFIWRILVQCCIVSWGLMAEVVQGIYTVIDDLNLLWSRQKTKDHSLTKSSKTTAQHYK